MADPMLGSIQIFAGTFAPRDWAYSSGGILPISENQALFAILGSNWGGDGRTNFAVPDYRSRVPVGFGQAPGFASIPQTYEFGLDVYTLHESQMPTHKHGATFIGTGGGGGGSTSASVTINAYDGKGDSDKADGKYWATGEGDYAGDPVPVKGGYNSTANVTMASDAVQVAVSGGGGGITGGTVTIGNAGGSQPFPLHQPSLGTAFIICIQGLFPSRN